MPEGSVNQPETQEPQAETPTQASKNFMKRWSDKLGNVITNEPLIPSFSTLFTLVGGSKALEQVFRGHYSSALNYGMIAGISVMIAAEVFPKSSLGTLIKKHVKKALQAYKDDLNNRHE